MKINISQFLAARMLQVSLAGTMNISKFIGIVLLLFIQFSIMSYCQSDELDRDFTFSTLLGGYRHEWINDLCLDNAGNIYVTGPTYSQNFPITQGKLKDQHAGDDSDVFIAKFAPTGELLFSSLLGGSNYDGNPQIELDSSGNIIIAGVTLSEDFPTTVDAFDRTYNGDTDLFITKINSACDSIIFSTYLGGNDQDHHPMMVLDNSSNIYITGPTRSLDFPITDNAFDRTHNGTVKDGYYGDVFVAGLNKDGDTLFYSTFLGGKNEETVFGINIARDGIICITGFTESIDFPGITSISIENTADLRTTNDVYLVGLDCRSQSLRFSTLFGGGGNDQGEEVVSDQHGNLYVVGFTSSSNFPTTPGVFNETYNRDGDSEESKDIFVCKFNASATEMLYSTYIGGKGDEGWTDIAVDSQGNAFVGGGTSSVNFPITADALDTTYNDGDESFVYRDAFLLKLDTNGAHLLYSTYVGGKGDDNVFKLTMDQDGFICIGGLTTSPDFPTTAEAFDMTYAGEREAFLLKLKP